MSNKRRQFDADRMTIGQFAQVLLAEMQVKKSLWPVETPLNMKQNKKKRNKRGFCEGNQRKMENGE